MATTQSCVDSIIKSHELWEGNKEGGKCAELSGRNMEGLSFKRKNLYKADISKAKLGGANFYGAILDFANLEGSDCWAANFTKASLERTNLKGVNLASAKGILRIEGAGSRACYFVDHIDDIMVKFGSFWGTIEKFEEEHKRHKFNLEMVALARKLIQINR
jgi:uncharacterized protein YjbI with pentapeptide repeats